MRSSKKVTFENNASIPHRIEISCYLEATKEPREDLWGCGMLKISLIVVFEQNNSEVLQATRWLETFETGKR